MHIAAIDIGTTKIVALVGRRNQDGTLEILGFKRLDSQGTRRGEILNPEEASLVLKKSVAELQADTGVLFSDVFVGIAGRHIQVLKSRHYINRDAYEEGVSEQDIQRLHDDVKRLGLGEGKEFIHIIPQNYIVDDEYGVINPIGMPCRRLEGNFNIVVGHINSIKCINKCMEHSGLVAKDIILEPLASADAVLFDEEREMGVAMIDIGGGTSDLAVFHDKMLYHSAVIPFGGYSVTRDIKEVFQLLERDAEWLKMMHGIALPEMANKNLAIDIVSKIPERKSKKIDPIQLAEVIQARMEEIIDSVMFHIINSGCADKLGAGIVLTGGGAMLKGLAELFQLRTGYDVRIGTPHHFLSSNNELFKNPSYATGVGLLMRSLDDIQTENLRQSRKSKTGKGEIKNTGEQETPAPPDGENNQKGGSWLGTWKNNIAKIFDSFTDTEM